MKTMKMYDAVVIGAGAAGMMAAGVCAKGGKSVVVLEKNEVSGRKIRISGKGRCNVTNDCTVQEVISAAVHGGKFLFSSLNAFSPTDTIKFFQDMGVSLKTERGRRVFPVSDNAHHIAQALEVFLRNNGAKIVRDTAREIIIENGRCIGVRGREDYLADSVLIACGGASYPKTGSNGDGARLAAAAGHDIISLTPSLVPLVEDGDICKRMQGLSLKNCRIRLAKQGGQGFVYEDFGELLFTHFGLSGPVILSASAHMEQGRYKVQIDLKPALSEKQLDARLVRDFAENKNKDFVNCLGGLLPQKMIPVFAEKSGIPGNIKCHSITKAQRRKICYLLKTFEIMIEGMRPINEAIVTRGGVNVKEINPKTMESKIAKGLYLAGEVIDVDAYTGGFNLQIAFSTGHAAGAAMAIKKRS